MIIFAFASMLIALLAVVFALSNTAATTVNFVVWSFQGSLALVLLAALFAGILVSFLGMLPSLVRNRWTIRQLRRKLQAAEDILSEHNLAPAQTSARAGDLKHKKEEPKRKPVVPVAPLPDLKPLASGEPTSPDAQPSVAAKRDTPDSSGTSGNGATNPPAKPQSEVRKE